MPQYLQNRECKIAALKIKIKNWGHYLCADISFLMFSEHRKSVKHLNYVSPIANRVIIKVFIHICFYVQAFWKNIQETSN